MVQFGLRRDRALAPPAADALLDRHRGGDAVDRVDVGARRRLDHRARVRVERFEVAPLSFLEQDVEGERGLAAAGDAGDDGERVAGDGDGGIAEIVLAGADDLDRLPSRVRNPGVGTLHPLSRLRERAGVRVGPLPHRRFILPQRAPGMGGRMRCHVLRHSGRNDLPARIPAFGAEIDDPVRCADDVEVVLDHDQRMPGRQQLAQGAHQARDVFEVQTGGGFVEKQQCTFGGAALAFGAAPGGLGEEAGDLQALRFAAREGRHGLAEAQIIQADVGERGERPQHVAVLRKQVHRFGDGVRKDVGDRKRAAAAFDLHREDFGAEALAVAVRAAQIDVGEELHLDVFESVATTGGAAAVAGVEAEGPRRVFAFLGQRRPGKDLADRIEGADEAGGVGAGGLADRRLVDEGDVGELPGTEAAVMRADRRRGLSQGAAERRVQHVLDQGGFARSRYAGHRHEAVQREGDGQRLKIVFPGADDFDAGIVGAAGGVPPLPCRRERVGVRVERATRRLHPLSSPKIQAGGGIRATQFFGRAVEYDLAAAIPRPRPHVQDAIGGKHDLRIVLHHHECVAAVAQPLHDADHPLHVARVQADRGFVQHEQGVDERSAERRRQVDPLHLAARERAALAVKG